MYTMQVFISRGWAELVHVEHDLSGFAVDGVGCVANSAEEAMGSFPQRLEVTSSGTSSSSPTRSRPLPTVVEVLLGGGGSGGARTRAGAVSPRREPRRGLGSTGDDLLRPTSLARGCCTVL